MAICYALVSNNTPIIINHPTHVEEKARDVKLGGGEEREKKMRDKISFSFLDFPSAE